MDVIGINEYFGWYYGKFEDVKVLLNKLAKKHPKKPLLITETGSDAAPGYIGKKGVKESSETYQEEYFDKKLKIFKSIDGYSGFSLLLEVSQDVYSMHQQLLGPDMGLEKWL